MADTVFPLPADVTAQERQQLRDGLAAHVTIRAEEERAVRFEGEQIGQTGPVHHFQYLRLYRIPRGFLAVGHDLREGMNVAFAERAEDLPNAFSEDTVREFVEDELRFRGVIGRAVAHSEP